MKNLKLLLIALAVLLLGTVNAISLDEFYEAVLNPDSISVGAEFDKFLSGAETVEDIDNAVQTWMSNDEAASREWIFKAYKKDKVNRNKGIARVLIETDPAAAQKLAKKLIILNRKDPLVYQVLVMNVLSEIAPYLNGEDWTYYKKDLIKQSSYLKRYYELAPETDWALFGKLALDMAQDRIQDARTTLDKIAGFNVQINRIFNLGDLVRDDDWRELLQYYVSLIPAHVQSYGDPEAMLDAASALSTYWSEHEDWLSIVNTFAPIPETLDLGEVFIDLLIAYDKLDRNREGLDLMASYSEEAAPQIITWWKNNYPEKDLETYMDNLQSEFPGDPVVDAALLGSLSDPVELLNAARNYCSAYPSSILGYKSLFSSWGEYFAKNTYSNDETDIGSDDFRTDLELWDDYALLNEEEAILSVQNLLERVYYGEKMLNATLIYTLRPGWIETPGIQFLAVNSFFNLGDYDSVIRLLNFMLDEKTISAKDLEQLAADENPVCAHKDWPGLLEYARSIATSDEEN